MFPILTTERFLLQQIVAEDQQFIFEGLSHPDVIRFYGVHYESFETTKAQMEWYDKMSANLSAAFQRMLSEPKAKRENSKQVHQFVVLNHILFSNIATVITGLKNKEPKQHSEQLQVSAKRSLLLLLRNSNKINNEGDNAIAEITKNATTADVATADDVLLKDQLEFIYKVSVDIDKTMSKINPS
jgi:hypothetical protein